MIQPPSAYEEGYARALREDPALAENYIRHTTIGDPGLDPVMEEISSLSPPDLQRFLTAGIEGHEQDLRKAPQPLRDFFLNLEEPPWLDYEAFRPGVRVFYANVDSILIAFVTGVLVEGFSTLIAKSFSMTGRVMGTSRRLRQNNRQLMEIFFPEGLRRNGDGWKLSMRVRLVHARVRYLLAHTEEWDHEAWGTPISAANLGLAIAVFSERLLRFASQVGAHFTKEEEDSILAVWRYTGYLMGIPETILYSDGEEARKVYRIGFLCEPPPSVESAAMANALIGAIPAVANVKDPLEREKVLRLAYRLSRALLGNQLADQFQYPKSLVPGTLFGFRMKQRVQRLLKGTRLVRANNFTQLLDISVYDKEGVSYKMPSHVKHTSSIPW